MHTTEVDVKPPNKGKLMCISWLSSVISMSRLVLILCQVRWNNLLWNTNICRNQETIK
jgi:hypothetical protein